MNVFPFLTVSTRNEISINVTLIENCKKNIYLMESIVDLKATPKKIYPNHCCTILRLVYQAMKNDSELITERIKILLNVNDFEH